MLVTDENTYRLGLYESLREKLLDLTRRNRMLSYPLGAKSKRSLQIVDTSLDTAFAKLTDQNGVLEIRPLKEPADVPSDEKTEEFQEALNHAKLSDITYLTQIQALENTGRDDEYSIAAAEIDLRIRLRNELGMPPRPSTKEVNRNDHARSLGIDPSLELSTNERSRDKNPRLQTLKFPDELESTLELIASDARLAEQEMGLSTLFLAAGFLEWYDSESSETKSFAPLLLLPVRLERRKDGGKSAYFISSMAEAADINMSLQKLLEVDFDRRLPNLDMPEEDVAPSVDAYLTAVGQSIQGLSRWKLHRWLVLGHFAFGRLAMYSDLSPENWNEIPHDQHLVKTLLQGSEDSAISTWTPPEDYNIDDPSVEDAAPILIQDADASQHSALVDVMRGANLVIQGPPGTGKSQTITNVIANALAANKTVLFLAEKRAALDVVKRRLDQCGLGDFCLELHSDKSSPKLVVQNLKRRFELLTTNSDAPRRHESTNPLWRSAKQYIREYLDSLHSRTTDQQTPFSLIWRSLRSRSKEVDAFLQRVEHISLHQGLDLEEIRNQLTIFESTCAHFEAAYGALRQSAWYQLAASDLVDHQTLGSLTSILTAMAEALERIESRLRDHPPLAIDALDDLLSAAVARKMPTQISKPELLSIIDPQEADALETHLRRQLDIEDAERQLKGRPNLDALPDTFREELVSAAKECDGSRYLALTLRECLIEATSCLTQLPDAASAVEALRPALKLFSLGDEFKIGGLRAVALCTQFAVDLRDNQLPWISNTVIEDEAAFRKFNIKRLQLRAHDSAWRKRFSSYAYHNWPTALELREAAGLIRRGGGAKLLSTITGRAQKANALARGLGVRETGSAASDILEKLAEHVESMAALWSDDAHSRIFGDAWLGPDTPFEQFDFVARYREYLRVHLLPLPEGDNVLSKFTALSPAGFKALRTFSNAARSFLALAKEVTPLLGTRSVGDFERDSALELAWAKKLAALKLSAELSESRACLKDFAEAVNLQERLAVLRREHQIHATQFDPSRLSTLFQCIDAAVGAARWASHLAHLHASSLVRAYLLSAEAASMRASMSSLVEMTEQDVASVAEGLNSLATRYGIDLGTRQIIALRSQAKLLLDKRSEAHEALIIREWQRRLAKSGLADFLHAVERSDLPFVALSGAFELFLAEREARRVRSEFPTLRSASGALLEAHRSAFADRDRQRLQDDRDKVRAALLGRPLLTGINAGPKKNWTEMALLRNEFQKQIRHTPVRSLVQRAANSVQSLTPCVMMSPLSLAKFVAPNAMKFDLLVIDEASQMRPEDAFGALLRCKQLVVVGDPKQLPPSQYFDRATDSSSVWDDDDQDSDDGSESILEACHKSFGVARQLKWHYRSRCESLIAFSNHEFYEDSLVTFPTAKPGSFSVSLIQVGGTYQARRNIAEAARIAEDAIKFMREFADAPDGELMSLGIVALNVEQRDLIQAEIFRMEAGDELVERYRERIAERGEEPFVKNLENVQGDERDYIFISMTYGKEKGASVLKQRFGPINSKSGDRRLNVLFTRARVRMAVFTSFNSIDVVPTVQSNEGVRVLKRYLEYAEQKGFKFINAVGEHAESDFELAVAERLRSEGFTVDHQVGVSGFRIDLAVRNPLTESSYVAGIECDGARFHSSKSARDRDRLREEVLRGLGWNILRVWSTDWFANPDEETRKLSQKIRDLQSQEASSTRQYTIQDLVDQPISDVTPETPGDDANAPHSTTAVIEFELPSAPIADEEAVDVLRRFRETVISVEMHDWERQRSILRESMIEALINERIVSPLHWARLPHYQRSGTNPVEKAKYFERICAIISLIQPANDARAGESDETEYKSTLWFNIQSGQRDPKIEFSALRAVASLLNSLGGKLIIGLSDKGEPLGLSLDGFENEDKMALHFSNRVQDRIGTQHVPHIRTQFEDFEGSRIMVVHCSPARRPVFLKDGTTERFFVRNGPSTREIFGMQLIEYLKTRFSL